VVSPDQPFAACGGRARWQSEAVASAVATNGALRVEREALSDSELQPCHPGELVAVVGPRGIRQDAPCPGPGPHGGGAPHGAVFIDGVRRHPTWRSRPPPPGGPGCPRGLSCSTRLPWRDTCGLTGDRRPNDLERVDIGGAGSAPGRRHPALPGRLSRLLVGETGDHPQRRAAATGRPSPALIGAPRCWCSDDAWRSVGTTTPAAAISELDP